MPTTSSLNGLAQMIQRGRTLFSGFADDNLTYKCNILVTIRCFMEYFTPNCYKNLHMLTIER